MNIKRLKLLIILDVNILHECDGDDDGDLKIDFFTLLAQVAEVLLQYIWNDFNVQAFYKIYIY